MRQTRGASRRRTSCAQQPAATETAMVWATPPDRRGATSGARSGVAHAMVSSSDCDRDARQRAAKSAAGFTDSHADDAEVSEHERNAARHRARRLRRSPALTRRGSDDPEGRPHSWRSAPRSSSSVGCQATSTRGER
jgi:hypothetical protein